MATRNITFSLPDDLLRAAKIHAAEHDTTVNSLVRDLLEEKLSREARARRGQEAACDRRAWPYFSADPSSYRREDFYERR